MPLRLDAILYPVSDYISRVELLGYIAEENPISCMVDQQTWVIIRSFKYDGKSFF